MTVTETTAAGRDAALEAWLDELHVECTFEPSLPLELVDVKASLRNQARIGEPLIGEVVDRYRADMERGDQFPPLLARRPSARSKKLVLLGGNHRHAAAVAAKRTTHPAYIVQCEPETGTLLCYGDNRRHGMPPSRAERIRQAVHLVAMGWTGQDAAAAVGVQGSEVSTARKVEEGRLRAERLEVPGWGALPASTRVELARIDLDGPFTEAVKLVTAARLSATDTTKLCQQIRSAGSESEALRRIGAELEERRQDIQKSVGGRARPQRTHFGALNGMIDTAMDLDAGKIRASAPDQVALKRARERLWKAAMHLADVHKALG